MRLYIIIFELARITDFEKIRFVEIMESFGDHIQLTKTSFMIASELAPVEMRNHLRVIREDARIFITQISSPAAWGNLICGNSEVKDMFQW